MDSAQLARVRADIFADDRKYDAMRNLIAEFGFPHIRIAADGDLEMVDDADRESIQDFAERLGGELCARLIDRLFAAGDDLAPPAIEIWDLQAVDVKARAWRARQRTE